MIDVNFLSWLFALPCCHNRDLQVPLVIGAAYTINGQYVRLVAKWSLLLLFQTLYVAHKLTILLITYLQIWVPHAERLTIELAVRDVSRVGGNWFYWLLLWFLGSRRVQLIQVYQAFLDCTLVKFLWGLVYLKLFACFILVRVAAAWLFFLQLKCSEDRFLEINRLGRLNLTILTNESMLMDSSILKLAFNEHYQSQLHEFSEFLRVVGPHRKFWEVFVFL